MSDPPYEQASVYWAAFLAAYKRDQVALMETVRELGVTDAMDLQHICVRITAACEVQIRLKVREGE
jgi:hypothetical protein